MSGSGDQVAKDSGARSTAVDDSGLDDFLDTRLEWRRLYCEVLGTFLLVLVAAGAGVVGALPAGTELPFAAIVLAPGIMVLGIILFMGPVSGAHLNPAVTWGFALRGDFPWRRVPGYLVAQLIGALGAALFLQLIFGGVIHGATLPGKDISNGQALAAEIVLTLGLVSVILGTSSGARNVGANAAIAVGGYIGFVVVWAAPVSGASMNPMRSFGPAAVAGHLSSYWIYVVGPLVGATIAVGSEVILRGRRPTKAGRLAAAGTLSPTDLDAQ